MNCLKTLAFVTVLASLLALAQQAPDAASQASNPAHSTTVRGCLQGQRGSYIVVANETSMVYVLKGVGNKLDSQLNHEVEVKGRLLPGSVKTGVSPEKAGSNPADAVHGVDGVVLQVADAQNDVRTIAKRCKRADQE